jgi:hypothetical protein
MAVVVTSLDCPAPCCCGLWWGLQGWLVVAVGECLASGPCTAPCWYKPNVVATFCLSPRCPTQCFEELSRNILRSRLHSMLLVEAACGLGAPQDPVPTCIHSRCRKVFFLGGVRALGPYFASRVAASADVRPASLVSSFCSTCSMVGRACHAVSSGCPVPTTMSGAWPMPICGCGSPFLGCSQMEYGETRDVEAESRDNHPVTILQVWRTVRKLLGSYRQGPAAAGRTAYSPAWVTSNVTQDAASGTCDACILCLHCISLLERRSCECQQGARQSCATRKKPPRHNWARRLSLKAVA